MMTFSEWITTQEATKWELDEASIEAITDHFYYRNVCDDNKMALFFWRTLARYREKYKQLVRVETIDFDPLVNRYFESQLIEKASSEDSGTQTRSGTHSGTNTSSTLAENNRVSQDTISGTTETEKTGSRSGQTSGTSSETDDIRKSGTHNTSTSGNNSTSTENNESSTDTTEGQTDTSTERTARSANKVTPMSAVNVGMTNGRISTLDFNYATGYEQNDADEAGATTSTETVEHNGNSTSTTSGSTSGTESGRNSETTNGTKSGRESGTSQETEEGTESVTNNGRTDRIDNGTESSTTQGSNSGTDEETVENSGSKTQNSNRTNRYTGRDGLTPQEAMAKASDYLMNYSPALEWLCRKLEICFIGIYDI